MASSRCWPASFERLAPRARIALPRDEVAGISRPDSFSREQPGARAVQPVLPFPSELNSPASPPAWSDVARLCRRVCVLREQGRHADAETLQRQELDPLLEILRTGADPQPTLDARLAATMAEESERVANATVLAELLAPMLGPRTGTGELTASVAALRPTTAHGAPAIAAPRGEPVRPAASIADFLDEMIAQESTPTRPPGPAQRRVS